MPRPPHAARAKKPRQQSLRIQENESGRVMLPASRIHSNVDQEVIVTTEDKVRLCLMDHLKRLERRNSWQTPSGVFVTVVATLLATTFHAFLGLPSEVWQALFLLVGLIAFGWLIVSLRQMRTSASIDDVVAAIKTGGVAQTQPEPGCLTTR